PGSAEGTVNITAYGTTRGLMNFINAVGACYGSGAIATVVKPQDIYPVHQATGTVSLCLNSTEGLAIVDGGPEYYTLDAYNGSDFCGNWVPGDAGTNWSAYKLDVTNGVEAGLAAVKQAANEEAAKALVDQYIGAFNSYIANVPQVAPELNAGIEALNNLVITDNYADDVATIWNEATSAANVALETVLDGQVVALKNLRRAAIGVTPYVGISTLETPEKYFGVASFIDVTADFTLKSAGEGGYTVYNEATKTWISTGCVPTTNEAEAQVLYPFLHAQGAYAGVALPQSAEKSGPGLNFQSWEAGAVSYWSVNDEGSIWGLVVADDEAKAKDVIDANVAKLEPYVNSLPDMVSSILTTAIAEIKALTYSETLGDEATAIADKALADANELLATGMNGIKLTLRNLRQNKFMSIANNVWVYDEYNEAEETVFTFKAQAEGGYILYNEAANIYVGEAVSETEGGQTDVTVATEEAAAMPVYPFLCKGGNFAGVALALEADPTGSTVALNTNNNASIFHTYRADDAGSIFALLAPNTVTSIEEVNAVKAQLQGIYDLSGRKLAAPVRGINIINGKKVLVK
ncbi:MAG: hypothetical protein K2J09_07425, partial [Muribaculaceae bacterium]|nr:hypothetical protein [Muribaculaceae bacterium]